MDCLFVHDFRSYKNNGYIYTGNLSYDIWQNRYIKYFENIKVLNRSGEMKSNDTPNRYVKASGDNITFLDDIDIFTPITFARNYRKYKKIIQRRVTESEYVIIRLDSFLGLIAANYCRHQKKKYLIEVVGCVWDSFWNKGIVGKLIAYPLFKVMQYEIKNAPYVVYVTEKFLQQRYPTKGKNTNISNVLLPKHDDAVIQNRLKHIKDIESDKEYIYEIVTVASVSVRYKGQDSVIRALNELKKTDSRRYRYHLIGGGNNTYLLELSKKLGVEDNVVFHGNLKHDNVIEFLDKCDVYIQPSKQEGLPRALIEGMSRGMICMGTDIAGIPELLQPKMLFSTRRNNYKEIASKISSLTSDDYKKQAIINFKEAQKYENDILSKRRESFFTSFRDS